MAEAINIQLTRLGENAFEMKRLEIDLVNN